MKRKIESIRISDIDLDTSQPRQVIEEDKLNDLADDMKEAGQLIPILLTPCYKKGEGILVIGKLAATNKKSKWFVLDGYRRLLAAKKNGWKKIDAELRYELDEMDSYEIQSRANSKRVQVTIKEMAKAIERYAKEWKKRGVKGDITTRLSKITGYSKAYFNMAKAISEEKGSIKGLINKEKVGAYYSFEKKASSKDSSIKEGMDEAVKEYVKTTGKKVGALTPRVLKPDFKKIEKKVKDKKARKNIAKAKTLDYLNRSLEVVDKYSNFDRYLYEVEEFYDKVLKWNIDGLTYEEVEEIAKVLYKTVTYLRETRRKKGMKKKSGKKGRNL